MRYILCVMFLAGLAATASADKLILNNGETVDGAIVSENNGDVVLSVSGVDITYYAEDIASIERGTSISDASEDDLEEFESFEDMSEEDIAMDEDIAEDPVNMSETMDAEVDNWEDEEVSADPSDDYDPSRESITISTGPSEGAMPEPEVEFDPVESSPEELEALEDAYNKYNQAMAQMMTMDDIKPFVVKEQVTQMEKMLSESEDGGFMMLQMMKAMMPQSPEIESIEIIDNKGIIMATGQGGLMGGESRGRLMFVKQDGQWKMEKSNWKSGDNLSFDEEEKVEFEPVAEIPDNAVSGQVQGKDFALTKASFNESMTILKLQHGEGFFADMSVSIFLFLNDKPYENALIEVPNDTFGGDPHVHVSWMEPDGETPKTESTTDGYQLKLETMAKADGVLPGKIFLKVPEYDVELQGAFNAVIE